MRKKTATIHIRVTPDEKKAFERVSNTLGLSIADMVRAKIAEIDKEMLAEDEAARRELSEVEKKIADGLGARYSAFLAQKRAAQEGADS